MQQVQKMKNDYTKFIKFYKNKKVLITGHTGFKGSWLSAWLNKLECKLYGLSLNKKNNADHYKILNIKYIKEFFFDIGNTKLVSDVISSIKPDIIFHAGALKHVTICEENVSEAIRTNVIATSMLANLAEKHSCKCFVLISTDKAVEPSSVMGYTKKLAELVIKSKDRLILNGPRYVVVRFGNVLGSTGSVVPLFKKQLNEGGPLTVTDKKATRFFMTIDEAVDLVVHSSAESIFDKKKPTGCINVLNMGASVKIDDLARQIIRLSGFVPDKDIKVSYIGLKKGEKLYEKLYADNEKKINEGRDGYFLVNNIRPENIDVNKLLRKLDSLCEKEVVDIRNKLFKILELN